MGVGREDSRDLKNIFFSVGVSHFDRVPRGRFEIGDDNFRPWQGVILYRAITIVSLPVIRTKKENKHFEMGHLLGSCN